MAKMDWLEKNEESKNQHSPQKKSGRCFLRYIQAKEEAA